MKTVTCHNCEREFAVHKDDICKTRTIGLVSPTNSCSRSYAVCNKCGTQNSVKEEDE